MKTAIIIGGGYSIKEEIEKGLWGKIKDKEIWSLNSVFLTMPYSPTRQIWVDANFFKNKAGEIQQLHKKGVELHCKKNAYYAFLGDMVNQYEVCRQKEFYKEKMHKVSHVFIGGHGLSGIFGMSLAVKEQYDLVYLLGYDWGNTNVEDRNTHYYQDKIKDLKIISNGAGKPSIYINNHNKPNRHIMDFDIFKKENTKFVNVSPNSHIYQFEKIDYDEFFRRLK